MGGVGESAAIFSKRPAAAQSERHRKTGKASYRRLGRRQRTIVYPTETFGLSLAFVDHGLPHGRRRAVFPFHTLETTAAAQPARPRKTMACVRGAARRRRTEPRWCTRAVPRGETRGFSFPDPGNNGCCAAWQATKNDGLHGGRTAAQARERCLRRLEYGGCAGSAMVGCAGSAMAAVQARERRLRRLGNGGCAGSEMVGCAGSAMAAARARQWRLRRLGGWAAA